MNKRGHDMDIILFVMVGIIVVGALFYFGNKDLELECKETCEDFHAEFYEFDSSGFGSFECWCNKDGEPLQVS